MHESHIGLRLNYPSQALINQASAGNPSNLNLALLCTCFYFPHPHPQRWRARKTVKKKSARDVWIWLCRYSRGWKAACSLFTALFSQQGEREKCVCVTQNTKARATLQVSCDTLHRCC